MKTSAKPKGVLPADLLKKRAARTDPISSEERTRRIGALRKAYDSRHRGVLRMPAGMAIPNLKLVKPGDIFASINTNSLMSRSIAKLINSPYSHAGVFLERGANGELRVRDFNKWRAGTTRPFSEAHKEGTNYIILRWEKASPQQLQTFIENIKRIKGKYDTPLAASYGIETQLKRFLGIDVHLRWDIEKWWTCSEQISHAADPSPGLLKDKILVPVLPPLTFNGVDRNEVTPRTIAVDAVNNRILRIVTVRKLPL